MYDTNTKSHLDDITNKIWDVFTGTEKNMFSKVKNILNSIIKKQNPIPDLIIIVLPVKKMVYNIFIENAGNRNFIISSSSHRMQFGVAMIAGKLLINQRAKINTHTKKKKIKKLLLTLKTYQIMWKIFWTGKLFRVKFVWL